MDGLVVQPVTASTAVEIGEFKEEVEARPAEWHPPDWDFVSVCCMGLRSCALRGGRHRGRCAYTSCLLTFPIRS